MVDGLFAALRPDGSVWDVTSCARDAGIPTVLVSNSWGTGFYPRQRLHAHFDALVISGEVGLRKPDPAIVELACERAGVAPNDAVFVDDLRANVDAAEALGMTGIHHTDDATTVAAVTAALALGSG